MKRLLNQTLVGVALVMFCATVAPAQEAPPADPAAAHAVALAEVKAAYSQIETLKTEFQTADETRRAQINQEFQALLASTRKKVDLMISTAIEAFRAAPMADEEVTKVLLDVVEHQMVGRGPAGGGDQYEAALPIIEVLIDGGHDKPQLPVWGALAAITTNDFGLAEKFVKIAEQTGAFTASPGEGEYAEETYGNALRYIKELPRYRQRWEAEQAIRLAEAEADDLPRVKLTTSKGDVVIELFENEAPIATANFLSLVKDGFYNGVVFHRVLSRFMAQGGDPTGSGSGGPGYSIACECHEPNARQHFRGSLSMAHAGRDTGGSQFFLCFVPTDFLDGRHTAFGRVVEGIEVLGELQRIDPQNPTGGIRPDRIVSAEVLRDRGHAYEFEKLPGR